MNIASILIYISEQEYRYVVSIKRTYAKTNLLKIVIHWNVMLHIKVYERFLEYQKNLNLKL